MVRVQEEEFLQMSHSPGPKIHSYKRSGPHLMPQSWGLSQVSASSRLSGALEQAAVFRSWFYHVLAT